MPRRCRWPERQSDSIRSIRFANQFQISISLRIHFAWPREPRNFDGQRFGLFSARSNSGQAFRSIRSTRGHRCILLQQIHLCVATGTLNVNVEKSSKNISRRFQVFNIRSVNTVLIYNGLYAVVIKSFTHTPTLTPLFNRRQL